MIDLGLTDDQCALVDGVRAFLADVRPIGRSGGLGSATEVHKQLVDFGWFGAGLPEDAGGLGLDVTDEALLYFEAGRALLAPSVLATTLAARLADQELRASLLSGRRRAALVMAAGASVDFCFDRDEGDVLVLLDDQELSLYPSTAFRGEPTVAFDESVAMEVGTLDGDSCLTFAACEHGILLAAAMLAGLAKASCELAVEYAKGREQFGQPIGAFQAVKHRCADMAVRSYAAEAQVRMAAASARDDIANSQFQIAAAARTAIVAARENGASAIQVHGGMGFTAECDAHLYLKRAHLLGGLIGGLEAQETWLLACPAAGEGLG